MILNRKVLAILLILIIIGITPASASTISDIQKEGDYIDKYTHNGGWYKFCHFFDFCGSVFKIICLANSAGSEMDSSSKQAEEQKLEAENSNIELQNKKDELKILSKYYEANSSKNDLRNRFKYYNTSNTNKKQASKSNYDNHTKTNNSATDGNDNSKLINNTDNIDDNNQTKKDKTVSKIPKKQLIDNANNVKNDLNKSGINVEVKNVNMDDLKYKSIVQLLNNNGYIKYMVYSGTKTIDDEMYVKLFNGQEYNLVLFNKFKKAYTGLVIEFNDSNNDIIQTEYDVAQKIYGDKLASLTSNINFHNNWLITANIMKGAGITISILVMILTVIASILVLAPEPAITKASAICCYKVALVGIIFAAALYVSGIVIESVSTGYKNEYVAEKTDLETFQL